MVLGDLIYVELINFLNVIVVLDFIYNDGDLNNDLLVIDLVDILVGIVG